jgi:A/G-specific adenine glycosylase
LGGMWEFPNGRVNWEPFEGLESALETGYRLKVQRGDALGVVQHAYTHFRVTVHAYRCELVSMSASKMMKWVRLNELNDYPMGKVDRQICRMIDG